MGDFKIMYSIDNLISLGRDMLNRGETSKTVNDIDAGYANNLTRVGTLLVSIGEPFGARLDEFSKADSAFIMREFREYYKITK